MALMNEHIETIVKGCIKITWIIQLNEYLNEETARDQVMKFVMMATHHLTMDEIQIELKSRIHGYVLEAV